MEMGAGEKVGGEVESSTTGRRTRKVCRFRKTRGSQRWKGWKSRIKCEWWRGPESLRAPLA
eukprot:4559581-Pyramimonas_sp.AAC.1